MACLWYDGTAVVYWCSLLHGALPLPITAPFLCWVVTLIAIMLCHSITQIDKDVALPSLPQWITISCPANTAHETSSLHNNKTGEIFPSGCWKFLALHVQLCLESALQERQIGRLGMAVVSSQEMTPYRLLEEGWCMRRKASSTKAIGSLSANCLQCCLAPRKNYTDTYMTPQTSASLYLFCGQGVSWRTQRTQHH